VRLGTAAPFHPPREAASAAPFPACARGGKVAGMDSGYRVDNTPPPPLSPLFFSKTSEKNEEKKTEKVFPFPNHLDPEAWLTKRKRHKKQLSSASIRLYLYGSSGT
jgi:hypothetical protein